MKPNSPPSIPFRKMVEAFALTIAVAGVVHLIIVGFTAVAKRDLGYINPLDYLGFSILFPSLRESLIANFIGWMVLLFIFIAILTVSINKHLDVSVIQDGQTNLKSLSQKLPKRKKS